MGILLLLAAWLPALLLWGPQLPCCPGPAISLLLVLWRHGMPAAVHRRQVGGGIVARTAPLWRRLHLVVRQLREATGALLNDCRAAVVRMLLRGQLLLRVLLHVATMLRLPRKLLLLLRHALVRGQATALPVPLAPHPAGMLRMRGVASPARRAGGDWRHTQGTGVHSQLPPVHAAAAICGRHAIVPWVCVRVACLGVPAPAHARRAPWLVPIVRPACVDSHVHEHSSIRPSCSLCKALDIIENTAGRLSWLGRGKQHERTYLMAAAAARRGGTLPFSTQSMISACASLPMCSSLRKLPSTFSRPWSTADIMV